MADNTEHFSKTEAETNIVSQKLGQNATVNILQNGVELDISAAMIEAGVQELADARFDLDNYEEIVESIYRAMHRSYLLCTGRQV